MALAADTEFDVAVLDIQLGSELVTDVACQIHERGKPIVFITGYADTDLLPDHLRGYPLLPKPVDPDVLVAMIWGGRAPLLLSDTERGACRTSASRIKTPTEAGRR